MTIKETGARLNTNWAVDILHNYTNHLRRDPNSLIKGPYYTFARMHEMFYQCSIILPSTSPIREFHGDKCAKKETAKRSAAYRAII